MLLLRQPCHFQRDSVERRQYVQRQRQGPRASFNPSRPQPRFYAPRHSGTAWTTLSIPPGKLEVPVVRSQTTRDTNPVGMIGRCPTVYRHSDERCERERTTGIKRLKGHGPEHAQYTRLHSHHGDRQCVCYITLGRHNFCFRSYALRKQ